MIEEQFVSLDTAKLLKEAGFDAPCYIQYSDIGIQWDNAPYPENFNADDWGYSCPTQALAARWLREVHRIVVDATFIPPSVNGDVWQYFVGEMDDMVWKGDYEPSDCKYATYEQAMEAGLQEAIKSIKKKEAV